MIRYDIKYNVLKLILVAFGENKHLPLSGWMFNLSVDCDATAAVCLAVNLSVCRCNVRLFVLAVRLFVLLKRIYSHLLLFLDK